MAGSDGIRPGARPNDALGTGRDRRPLGGLQTQMKILVVARHNEDVSWLEEVAGWEGLVVQKGLDLPNVGREASSYLWAMQRLYDGIADDDLAAFCQGSAFDHFDREELDEPVEWFRPLGARAPTGPISGWHRSFADGAPDHPGLPIRESYEAWVARPWPGHVDFVAGAQFIVTGACLKQHPKERYAGLAEQMNGPGPWVMERLWAAFFNAERE